MASSVRSRGVADGRSFGLLQYIACKVTSGYLHSGPPQGEEMFLGVL